jgi:hypothetical protein
MNRSFRSACVLTCLAVGSVLAGPACAQDTLSNATPMLHAPTADSTSGPAVTAIHVGVRPMLAGPRADTLFTSAQFSPAPPPIHFPKGKGYPMLIGGITASLLGVYVIPGNAGGAVAITGALVGLYGLYVHFRD